MKAAEWVMDAAVAVLAATGFLCCLALALLLYVGGWLFGSELRLGDDL